MIAGIKAICSLAVIPVRSTHEDSSEIVTQLLFGEIVTVIGIHNQWVKINIQQDNYEGWVDNKQLIKISEITFEKFKTNTQRQQESILTIITPWGKQNVLQGSPILSNSKSFKIDDLEFSWANEIPTQKLDSNLNIKDLALSYSNSPYLWGGRTAFGIDCSGFTQTVFHQVGLFLPRDASQQYLEGTKIDFEQLKSGDLAFFKSETTGNIHHVGIVLPNQQIIHAHGRVRIDTLDKEGIYNENKNIIHIN